MAAGRRRQPPAAAVDLDVEHRAPEPAPGQALPAADHLEAVVVDPLEALERERQLLAGVGHQASRSGGGAASSSRSSSGAAPVAHQRGDAVAVAIDGDYVSGLGGRRAVVDGGHALGLAPIDLHRERHAPQAQHRADDHRERGAERQPRAGVGVKAGGGGRRAEDLGDHQHEHGEHGARQPAASTSGKLGRDPAGRGGQRQQREGGEQQVGDLEHGPCVRVAVPLEEQAHQQHQAAEGHDQRADLESSHHLQVTNWTRQKRASVN